MPDNRGVWKKTAGFLSFYPPPVCVPLLKNPIHDSRLRRSLKAIAVFVVIPLGVNGARGHAKCNLFAMVMVACGFPAVNNVCVRCLRLFKVLMEILNPRAFESSY